MFRILLIVFVSCPLLLSAQLKASDVDTFRLDNGMKFLVVEDFSIPNANMYLFYKVGSRNEYQGITGLSHFFEHMMFNGAKKYGPKEFDRVMEFNGGANNAYTTNDVTVYTDWFPASSSEVIFDLESDRIANLSIAPEMVESERGVVLSERRTGLENSPWRELIYLINGMAFMEHPYQWPVIGYEDDMKNWTQEDLEAYFETYYAPNNCVVVISGAITTEEVKKLAEKYMAPIASQPAPPKVHIKEPEQKGERRFTHYREVATPYMMISYHVPEATHEDYYALSLLSAVLSNGNSSRLYSSLVDDQQMVSQIGTLFDASFDPGLFTIYALASPQIETDSIETGIYQELEKILTEGITEEELQKVKNQKLIEFYQQIQTINGKSNNIGTYEVFFGDYAEMFNAPEAFNKVTREEIKEVAQKYLTHQNKTVGIIRNQPEN